MSDDRVEAGPDEPIQYGKKKDKVAKPHVRETAIALLNDEDIKALKEKAAKEVREDYKDVQRSQMYKRLLMEERGRYDPEETLQECVIDLPGHSNRIVINGAEYFHGGKYTVSLSLYRSFLDIMARAWEHEESVGNANRREYQKPRNTILGPAGVSNSPVINQAQSIMRV